MKKRWHILLPLALAVVMSACSSDDDKRISQGKMANVLADMQLAEAYANNHVEFSSDSAKNVLRMSVLKKHGITQEEYDRTLDWYAHNLENYSKLYDDVEKRLDKRQNKLLASTSGNAEAESASSLWPYSPMAMISPLSNQDALQFSIPVSDMPRGERLIWTMRMSEPVSTRMLLGVDYTDGTTAYIMRRSNQKQLELNFQSDSSLTISRVYGYMQPDNNVHLPVWADSIIIKTMPLAKETYHTIQQQNHYKGTKRSQPIDTTQRRPTVKPITDRPMMEGARPGTTNINLTTSENRR